MDEHHGYSDDEWNALNAAIAGNLPPEAVDFEAPPGVVYSPMDLLEKQQVLHWLLFWRRRRELLMVSEWTRD